MSSTDARYPAASGGGSSSPPVVSPHYNSSLPSPPGDPEGGRHTRCATGFRFLSTFHGILNIITFIALICVIIGAGVANSQDGINADNSLYPTDVKLSAFHTRNAVLVFAIFGLILILFDSIIHITSLINRIPVAFDKFFIITMLVLAGIYLILGCCAAAWEQKMRDTVGFNDTLKHKGAAAAASFFLFVSMIAILINFILRLISRPSQSYNPTAIINRNAYDPHRGSDASSRF